MKSNKDVFVPLVAVTLFLAVAGHLAWRESAQIYLKDGIARYEQNRIEASDLFDEALKRNPNHYLLHIYQAKILQKTAFDRVGKGMEPGIAAIESEWRLLKALELRTDATDYLLLAQNDKLRGRLTSAIVRYNIAFFLSQDREQLVHLDGLQSYQAEASADAFRSGHAGVAMMIAYNHLTGFTPFFDDHTAATRLLKDFFLTVAPDRWLSIGQEEAKSVFAGLFRDLSPSERDDALKAIRAGGLGHLADLLEAV